MLRQDREDKGRGLARSNTLARYKLFVAALLSDPKRNATNAAIAAGYSPKTARSAAHRTLKVPLVKKLIAEREAELRAKYDMTAESVLKELAGIVHFDVRKLYNPDGTLKNLADLDDATAHALASLEVDELKLDSKTIGQTKKVKMFDKNSAIEKAMKHFGLLKDGGVNLHAGTVVISKEDAALCFPPNIAP